MKHVKKTIFFSIIIVLFIGCGDSSTTTDQLSSEQQTHSVESNQLAVDLSNFSKEDVARYAMSSIMGQPSNRIKVRIENELYYVSYVRKSDSKKFDYKIKINGNKIVWANIDGRWRDSEYDARLSFEERDNILKITQTFSDGSVEIIDYKQGQ